MYPQLRIDFLAVKGVFGPDLIERFPHKLPALGGVRLILSGVGAEPQGPGGVGDGHCSKIR
jgi:hypothetical protein